MEMTINPKQSLFRLVAAVVVTIVVFGFATSAKPDETVVFGDVISMNVERRILTFKTEAGKEVRLRSSHALGEQLHFTLNQVRTSSCR